MGIRLFDEGRYRFVLRMRPAAFASGAPGSIRDVFGDLGFVDVDAHAQADAPAAHAAILKRYPPAQFPEWLTVAEASWPRAERAFDVDTELFEVLAVERRGDVPKAPTLAAPSVVSAAGLVAGVGLVVFVLSRLWR